jgi:23S rRNA (cytosine1962-C5)-methyltransferase
MSHFTLLSPADWSEYALLDSGDEERLEQFGMYRLRRPDPTCLWGKTLPATEWQKADASYQRSFQDKGTWRTTPNFPEHWNVSWQQLRFQLKLTPFKHTGLFPEQSAHWAWLQDICQRRVPQTSEPKVLNLFGYTGAASMVAAAAGAKVTHLDASRAAIGWAKTNQVLSNLDLRSIRWILDDAIAFVRREVKRGVKYHGLIMDPPIYGHGPKGERWDFRTSLPELMHLCSQVLAPDAWFVVMNAYAVSTSALTLHTLVSQMMAAHTGKVDAGELVIPHQANPEQLLSTGIWARWESGK